MMANSPARLTSSRPSRPDLSDRRLRWLMLAATAIACATLAATMLVPAWRQRPGTPLFQTFAVLGSVLLLTPFAFVVAKRGGMSRVPNRWLIAHVVAGLAGLVLVVVHSGGVLWSPPSVMLYALVGLVVSGAYARLRVAADMASTLGRKRAAFAAPDHALRAKLARIIEEKSALLARLDPGASEATFSVTLRHWLRSPIFASRYAALAAGEARLIGARGSVGRVQAWWRPLHMALAALFLAALVVHVIAVTFFAGYVAGGRAIYWWHVTAW